MHISEENRWEIVSTWKTCKNITATACAHKVSRLAVRRWVQRYNATHAVTARRKPGRKHALSPEATKRALHLLLNEQSHGVDGVAVQLLQEGLTSAKVHKCTVIRAAKKMARQNGADIQAVRGKPRKRLTLDTKSKRLQFCSANLRRSWANVMFTDRKKFLFSYPGAKVSAVEWVQRGSSRQAACVNHPQCVNLYAGITRYGVTSAHLVAGTSKQHSTHFNKQGKPSKNITASEYVDVVKSTLLPEGRRIFTTRGISSWVLQQDNDPSHKVASASILDWNTSHASSVSLLGQWPPNSPDLNPIENVWSYVQAKVDKMGCKTFEEFKEAVLMEIKIVPRKMLINLFDSMPRRMAKVIQLDGDKTKY